MTREFFIALSAAVGVGCVPLASSRYVGDEAAGQIIVDKCLLGKMPEGIVLSRSGIQALVNVREWRGDEIVNVRYDIGEGHHVQLQERVLVIDVRDGSKPRVRPIDSIDLWDWVPEEGYAGLPGRRAGLAPTDLVMDDSQLPPLPTGPRPYLPIRHYWMATHVQTGRASQLWVKLPDLVVDGVTTAFPEIRFDRKPGVVLAPLNC